MREIRFTPALGFHGQPHIRYCSDVNPTDYILASLLAAVLGDSEFTFTFAQMINWKMNVKETKIEFSVSLDTSIKNWTHMTH